MYKTEKKWTYIHSGKCKSHIRRLFGRQIKAAIGESHFKYSTRSGRFEVSNALNLLTCTILFFNPMKREIVQFRRLFNLFLSVMC